MKDKKKDCEVAAVIGPYHLADYFRNLNLNALSDILILGDYSERGIKMEKMLLDFSGIDIRDEDLSLAIDLLKINKIKSCLTGKIPTLSLGLIVGFAYGR